MFAHFPNAWQTKRPEEFIEEISLQIPRFEDVKNPFANKALMELIGAKRIYATFYYELKNAATGTRFTFGWSSDGDMPSKYLTWTLEKTAASPDLVYN